MAIISRKPRNSSLRFQQFIDTSDLSKKKPERSLVVGLKRSGGRNAYGRITVRHRGGGAAKRYRIVDFKRSERNINGKIVAVEYDPNRNVRIGLVSYLNGAKTYMLMPDGIGIGSSIYAGIDAEAKIGNSLPLRNIPVGFMVHNIEVTPSSGGTFARSAGTSAQLMAKTEDHATLKMPSGEIRMVLLDCWATVGVLGNAEYKNINWGKAGRTRHKGIRPTVRGMAMNPVDHPHGGGEGRTSGGRHPVSPTGKPTKGAITRSNKRTNKDIIRSRRRKK